MEIERFGIGIAVLPWQFFVAEFGAAVWSWQLPGTFRWNWDLPFNLAFVIVYRDLSYLTPNRGVVWWMRWLDIGLQIWELWRAAGWTAGSPLLRDSPEALVSIPVDRFSTLINRRASFRRSLISTPGQHPRIPGNQSQHDCRHILKNPTVTNSTNRRISSHTTIT